VPISFRAGPVSVRTPATSANLGPGFDALGVALTLYDEVTAEVVAGDTTVEVSGEGEGCLPAGEDHLIIRAMRTTFGRLGGQPEAIRLRSVNGIPQARGLGSSSAAIVAGVTLAQALARTSRELAGTNDRKAALRLHHRLAEPARQRR
jgi:homoserine kinase